MEQKEPTLEQLLGHLYELALQANAPAKVHAMSQKAFDALRKAIEPKTDVQKANLAQPIQDNYILEKKNA